MTKKETMNLFWKKLPSTDKLEKDFQEKKRIYRDMQETESSAELKEYKELEAIVKSSEFQKKKKEVEKLNYKKTPAYEKEVWVQKMNSRKDVQDFLALKDSKELEDYLAFKETEDYVMVADKAARKADQKLDAYFKFERSKKYIHYTKLNNSSEIVKFIESEKEVEEKEFKDYKAFCLDKNRWSSTDEGKQEARFNELENLDNIKEYLSYKDLPDFDFYKEWELIFEDNFTENIIDPTKWISVPYWGNRNNIGAYSLYSESHALSEDAMKLNGNTLKMIVAPKTIEGKAWHAEKGFVPKTFSHQAAMINTGDHFSQAYGRIEAKIKMNGKMPVGHAFYICSEDNTDQITIMKSVTSKRFKVGVQHQNKNNITNRESLIKGKKIFNYHIIAAEWSKNEISWYLNDKKVHTETNHVPHKPMYLVFSSFATDKAKSENGEMEIDWVRVYSRVN